MQVDIEIQDELGIVKMKASENQHYSARKLAYMAYLKTPHWENLRQERFKIDSQRCVSCGSGSNIQGHHIKYRDDYATCTVDDIVTLCFGCHDYMHQTMKGSRIRNGSLSREQTMKILAAAPRDPETGKISGIFGSMRERHQKQRSELLKAFPEGFPPNGDGSMVMTKEVMQLLKADSGTYTSAAMKALGTKIGKQSGWVDELVGKSFTLEQIRAANNRRNMVRSEMKAILGEIPRPAQSEAKVKAREARNKIYKIAHITGRKFTVNLQAMVNRMNSHLRKRNIPQAITAMVDIANHVSTARKNILEAGLHK